MFNLYQNTRTERTNYRGNFPSSVRFSIEINRAGEEGNGSRIGSNVEKNRRTKNGNELVGAKGLKGYGS